MFAIWKLHRWRFPWSRIAITATLAKVGDGEMGFRTKAACTGSIRPPQTTRGGKTPSSVSGIPIPEITCSLPGEPRTVFSVCQPEVSPLWLVSLLLLSGDVEENPGPPKIHQPTTSTKQTWICQICTNKINHNQTSYLCHNTDHWVHKKCSETLQKDYHGNWTCKLHQNNQTATDLQTPNISQQIPAQATNQQIPATVNQQITTGQPTIPTHARYHHKIKEMINQRNKIKSKPTQNSNKTDMNNPKRHLKTNNKTKQQNQKQNTHNGANQHKRNPKLTNRTSSAASLPRGNDAVVECPLSVPEIQDQIPPRVVI